MQLPEDLPLFRGSHADLLIIALHKVSHFFVVNGACCSRCTCVLPYRERLCKRTVHVLTRTILQLPHLDYCSASLVDISAARGMRSPSCASNCERVAFAALVTKSVVPDHKCERAALAVSYLLHHLATLARSIHSLLPAVSVCFSTRIPNSLNTDIHHQPHSFIAHYYEVFDVATILHSKILPDTNRITFPLRHPFHLPRALLTFEYAADCKRLATAGHPLPVCLDIIANTLNPRNADQSRLCQAITHPTKHQSHHRVKSSSMCVTLPFSCHRIACPVSLRFWTRS